MKKSISWEKSFTVYSEIEMVDPTTVDNDFIFEVTRDYEGVFEEEHFDVVAYEDSNNQYQLEVHEGGYVLTEEEEGMIKRMLLDYLLESYTPRYSRQ